MCDDNRSWARVDANSLPQIRISPPGPRSREIEARAGKYMTGYSSQAHLFPVAFDSGHGVTLTDVDGNTYIDFSSGIYITNFGHCHPKITEAVVREVRRMQNCHDFNSEIKTRLVEKLVQITPGDLNQLQLWCEGSKAVEAALNVARAVTGKYEFISFHNSMHGKTQGVQSLTSGMTRVCGIKAPGSYRAPFGNCYRCAFKLQHPGCGIHCVDYLREVIEEQTTHEVAAIVLEPIQGWGGSVVPAEEFIPRLRRLCDEYGILLLADEVLTCMGRTGRHFAVQHWDVVPDIMTLGKGFGNGFPVTAVIYSERFREKMKGIKASSSYGGNPPACAAALASIEVMLEEGMMEHANELGAFIMGRLREIQSRHQIVGQVRGKGCLLGIEIVKNLETHEPFVEAGERIYQEAFRRGVAWIPAKQNLRMSPPLIMSLEVAAKALEIIEEAIDVTERDFGYNPSASSFHPAVLK